MLKRFVDGLVFGSGFAIAFVAIVGIAFYTFMTSSVGTEMHEIGEARIAMPSGSTADKSVSTSGALSSIPFHELSVEDQIAQSSVIALLQYERIADGKSRAIIKEFLKKDPNATVHYKVGDEYPHLSHYREDKEAFGDGQVMFMTGSPATMKMTTTYSGDRLSGLGDLPLALFKEKCASPGTRQAAETK
jgi:hypothetical protein